MIKMQFSLGEMEKGDLFYLHGGLIKLCVVTDYMEYETIEIFDSLVELEDYVDLQYGSDTLVFEKIYEY